MSNLKHIQQDEQAVKNYWQTHGLHSLEGEAYLERRRREIYTANWMAIIRACIEFGELGGSKLVLEVGCGWGRIIVGMKMCMSDLQIHGLDLVDKLIQHARDVVMTETGYLNVHLSVGNAQELPFNAACFDAVISARVLQYVPDPILAVKEFARVVKPGGKIVVLLPNKLNPVRRRCYPAKLHTPSEIGTWFEEARLQEIDTRSVCFIPPWFRSNHHSRLLCLEALRKVPVINQYGGMAVASGRRVQQKETGLWPRTPRDGTLLSPCQ